MDNIRFSVHIPVYNAQKFLAECVDSVLNQDYGYFELILTDDGSTDGSGEICDSFTDERIRVFHNENQGPLLTRVFSVSKARGEYSIFIDCDDTVDNGFFKELNEIISAENCDMVVCSFKSVSGEGVKKAYNPWNETTVFNGDDADIFRREFMLNSYLNSMCTKVIRTELLKQDETDFVKFASFRHGEDRLQSLYPVFNCEKIAYIPKCYYNYRVNEQSITHTPNVKKYEGLLRISKETYKYFENSSFFDSESRTIYASNFVRSIMQCVREISCADIPEKDKVDIFNKIADNSFFRKISDDFDTGVSDKKTKSVYFLFKSKAYRTIVLMMKLLNRK